MNARTALSALTVGALLLTACSSPAVEPPGLTASPKTTSEVTPTTAPSPSPTDGIQVHSDPEVGLVFDDVPDLKGTEAEVYNWVATFQTAFWQTLRTNQVSPVYAGSSSAEVQETMAGVAAGNATSGVRIGGEFHTRISNIVVTEDAATGVTSATATVCDDLRKATFTTDSGSFTAKDVQQDVPQRNTFELYQVNPGVWYFNRVIGDGTC